MVDLSNDPSSNYLMVASELEKSRILTVEPEGEVEITRRGFGSSVQFIWDGVLEDCTPEDVVKLLREYKIRSALVRIRGKATLDHVEDAVFGNAVFRPTLVVANKADLEFNQEEMKSLKEAAEPLDVEPISTLNTPNLANRLGAMLFTLLGIRRIYTKEPGKEASTIPIVVRGLVNVGELAKNIHSDFYKSFKYARLWGKSAKFPGERVGMDRLLSDGDIVELHV
jgi:ribosome-interacting GTPase 1